MGPRTSCGPNGKIKQKMLTKERRLVEGKKKRAGKGP